jgi:hypothetical protein
MLMKFLIKKYTIQGLNTEEKVYFGFIIMAYGKKYWKHLLDMDLKLYGMAIM